MLNKKIKAQKKLYKKRKKSDFSTARNIFLGEIILQMMRNKHILSK